MEKIKEVRVSDVTVVGEDGTCIRNLEESKKTDESAPLDVTLGTETKIYSSED